MNKEALCTVGRKLDSNGLFILSVFDLEPSGVLVQAYSQITSKEYLLPVSEAELAAAGFTRSQSSLLALLETLVLAPAGGEWVLASTNLSISRIRRRPTGEEVEKMLKEPISEGSDESLHSLIVTGCVELSKVKPIGIEAVQWLGEWLIANNPNKPRIDDLAAYAVDEPADIM